MLSTAIACGGGSDGSTANESPRERFDRNLQKWMASGISSYEFTYQKLCFCLIDETQEVRILVRDGQIVSVSRVSDGMPVDSVPFDAFSTVDDLFDLVQRAIEQNAAKLEVEYDPLLGFPTLVDIDFAIIVADDEITIRSSNLQPQ